MTEELKQYKAFGKFVEWMGNQQIGNDSVGLWVNEFYTKTPIGFHRKVSDRELLSLLVEFCDSERMCIEISTHLTGGECLFSDSVWNVKEITKSLVNDSFISTRTEATKQAIVKIFELMESER